MEEEYVSGKYSVEQSNVRQFALIKAEQTEIEEFVRGSVALRRGFQEFVRYCARQEVRLVVVSSGLDLYIGPALERWGLTHLEVHSGRARATPEGIIVQYVDPLGAVITAGFKESYLRHLKRQGNTVIYVGDGLSDRVPASEADFVIARSKLAEILTGKNLPYLAFDDFADVEGHVEAIRHKLRG